MKTERSPAGHGDAAADVAVRDWTKAHRPCAKRQHPPAPASFVSATADGQAEVGQIHKSLCWLILREPGI